MSIRIFGAAALLAVLAQASNVHVHNNCNFEVKAVPSHEGTDHSDETIQPGGTFTRPSSGSAWCLKLYGKDTSGNWANKPTQLEWSTWEPSPGNTILSYDLSDIDMGQDTTFLQHGMNLTSEDPTCDSSSSTCRPAICKPQGSGSSTSPCEDAYNQPFDVRTLGASASYDINMVLCTNDDTTSSSSDSSDSSAPASSSEQASQPQQTTMATSAYVAAPSSSAVPVQADSNGNVQEGGNVVTEWAYNTQVVTQIVTARNAEPTMEKRHAGHPHGHHARHNHQ